MTTLVSELVRVLSSAAASELRRRADGEPLTRSEVLAIATLGELAAGLMETAPFSSAPASEFEWDALQRSAEWDLAVVVRAENRRRESKVANSGRSS